MNRPAGHPRRWQILAILCLSLVLIGLDTLILNLALPSIQKDLDATSSQLQWTVDSYALAFGGLLLMAGGLSDRFGRKRLLAIGLAAFALTSLGAAFASSPELLITFRAAMGIAAALMMPATLAIIKDVFPPEEQGKAIGIWSGAAAVGVPLGPLVSGLLLEHFWWGSMFIINVPLAAIALIGGFKLIPESKAEGHPGLDLVGALLSVAGLVAIVYGLVEAPHNGWSDIVTLGSLFVGVALMVGFILWERSTENPMLDVGLFLNTRYGGGALAIACTSFGLYSGLYLLTQYLQSVLELDPLGAGLRMLAIGTMMVGAPLSPKLVERVGLKATVVIGLLLCAGGLGMLAGLQVDDQAQALWGLAVFGLGMGIALPAAVDAILVVSAARQAGAGSAVADVGMQVGGALGIAVSGSVISTLYRDDLPQAAQLPGEAGEAVRESLAGAAAVAEQVGGAAGERVLSAAQASFVNGFTGTLLIAVAVATVGAVASAFILPRQRVVEADGATDAALPAQPGEAGVRAGS
ncbi:DHA2 family efflux MFS transporter permease subunit [Streptomyces sp. NBC_00846]|uniref:MFS transporter n=1 Tax=Streptomyces sp. NBC_00846 TaxID=2975849 RepID=UPI003864A6A0|nr:DHA2 family efflux MFS transporter permease subunit [Streptomyces sp. NBC_00846]